MNKNKYIDHTLLKPESTPQDIEKICLEAKEYDFASVCIQPCYVKMAYGLLKETDVKVCTVIGFPLGANTTETKIREACQAVEEGAEEIDMVINIGALKAGDTVYVTEEIRRIKEAIGDLVLKVIIETCLLTDEEKVLACQCAVNAGADFVKTSTGFSRGGATVADVRLMKQTVGDRCQVKASGGIRTPEDFEAMIEAGATRIGTSSGIKLI
ncbi:MAG: deoxyribose-phosphate aldolase [Solobacterium sp.]|nr:deoxyribose-phosphate aldolase [Solobacterium sp.]